VVCPGHSEICNKKNKFSVLQFLEDTNGSQLQGILATVYGIHCGLTHLPTVDRLRMNRKKKKKKARLKKKRKKVKIRRRLKRPKMMMRMSSQMR